MKTAKIMLASLVLVFLAPLAFSAAPMADKLPEDCLLYVGWAGRHLTFDGSLMGRMLKEPEVGKIVASVKGFIMHCWQYQRCRGGALRLDCEKAARGRHAQAG